MKISFTNKTRINQVWRPDQKEPEVWSNHTMGRKPKLPKVKQWEVDNQTSVLERNKTQTKEQEWLKKLSSFVWRRELFLFRPSP